MQKYNTKQKKLRFRSSLANVNHTIQGYQSDVCIFHCLRAHSSMNRTDFIEIVACFDGFREGRSAHELGLLHTSNNLCFHGPLYHSCLGNM